MPLEPLSDFASAALVRIWKSSLLIGVARAVAFAGWLLICLLEKLVVVQQCVQGATPLRIRISIKAGAVSAYQVMTRGPTKNMPDMNAQHESRALWYHSDRQCAVCHKSC